MTSRQLLDVDAADVLCFKDQVSTTYCWDGEECLFWTPGGAIRREYERPDFSDGFSVSALVLSSLSIVVALAGVVFLVANRRKPVLRMSQYSFLMLFTVSFVVFNVAMLLNTISFMGFYDGLCSAFFSLYYLGLVALFTALALKTYRAWRLLKGTETLQKVKLSNSFLYKCLAASEVLPVVLLITWFSAFPLQQNPCTLDEGQGQCQTAASFFDDGGHRIDVALTVYLVLIFLVTLVVAYQARRVPSIASESLGIFVSVLMVWLGIMLSGILFNSSADASVQAFVVAAYFFVTTVVSLHLILFRKARFFHLSARDIRTVFLSASSSAGSRRSKGSSASVPSPPDAVVKPGASTQFTTRADTTTSQGSSEAATAENDDDPMVVDAVDAEPAADQEQVAATSAQEEAATSAHVVVV